MFIKELAKVYNISSELSDREIIFEFLKKECGFDYPVLKFVLKVETSQVDLNNINYDPSRVNYLKTLPLNNIKQYPIILFKRPDGRLSLLDGYHRVAHAVKHNKPLIQAYVLS